MLHHFIIPKKINDITLIRKIKQFKPQIILINLGGGTQEILGSYIIKKLIIKLE